MHSGIDIISRYRRVTGTIIALASKMSQGYSSFLAITKLHMGIIGVHVKKFHLIHQRVKSAVSDVTFIKCLARRGEPRGNGPSIGWFPLILEQAFMGRALCSCTQQRCNGVESICSRDLMEWRASTISASHSEAGNPLVFRASVTACQIVPL